MVIKGKCRGNGLQLAEYLLSDKNDRAELLEITGTTAPNNLKRSLVEMGLTALMTKSEAGLYHAQINPDPKEPGMTKEAWKKSVEILARELGLEGQRRAIVLHEKNGRTHAHVVFERYQEGKGKDQQGILWSDDKNYKKHEKASRAIEKALGHERTPEKADRQKQAQNERKTDVKKTLTELWKKHSDPEKFIAEAAKLGFTVSKGEDRRPYKVIAPDGQSLDLVRQLEKVKTKEVAERLNPIRETLKTEKEALAAAKKREQEKPQPKKEPAPPMALKWDLGTVQISSSTPPAKPANDNMQDKIENLHKLAKFRANEVTEPQEQPKQPAEPPKASQTDKERQEAKLKEMREREEANRREQERRKQLTKEQREAEDKARFEAKLKEMREQEQTRQKQRGLER